MSRGVAAKKSMAPNATRTGKKAPSWALKDMRMQGLPSMVPLSGPGPEHGESKCGLAEQKKCAALVTIGGSSFSSSSVPA